MYLYLLRSHKYTIIKSAVIYYDISKDNARILKRTAISIFFLRFKYRYHSIPILHFLSL